VDAIRRWDPPPAAARLHHVERADDVGVDIGARVLEAVADPRLRREMHDDVGPELVGHAIEQRLVLQQRLGRGKSPGFCNSMACRRRFRLTS
jgi:hypothetical protein